MPGSCCTQGCPAGLRYMNQNAAGIIVRRFPADKPTFFHSPKLVRKPAAVPPGTVSKVPGAHPGGPGFGKRGEHLVIGA